MDAAFALLELWVNSMHAIGHVPYAPDFFFVGTGFAGAFLLEVCLSAYPTSLFLCSQRDHQLLRPHIAPTLSAEQREKVIKVCKTVIGKLRAAAADEAHAPYSYAVFLEGALEKAVVEPPIPAPTAKPAHHHPPPASSSPSSYFA